MQSTAAAGDLSSIIRLSSVNHHSIVESREGWLSCNCLQRHQESRTLVGKVDCPTTDELHALVDCCPARPCCLLHRADVRQHAHPRELALPSRWFLAAISSALPT